jgi:hypothetical protein
MIPSTLSAVVIPLADESVLVLVLDAVERWLLDASGVLELIPVAGIHVQRQLVETLNDRVTCCDPVERPVPFQIATRREVAPSTWLRISVQVPPAPETDMPLPPVWVLEMLTQTNAVSPAVTVSVRVADVALLIDKFAGVRGMTGKPISFLAWQYQMSARCRQRPTPQ